MGYLDEKVLRELEQDIIEKNKRRVNGENVWADDEPVRERISKKEFKKRMNKKSRKAKIDKFLKKFSLLVERDYNKELHMENLSIIDYLYENSDYSLIKAAKILKNFRIKCDVLKGEYVRLNNKKIVFNRKRKLKNIKNTLISADERLKDSEYLMLLKLKDLKYKVGNEELIKQIYTISGIKENIGPAHMKINVQTTNKTNKPAHMKENTQTTRPAHMKKNVQTEDNYYEIEQIINSSKHFSNAQKIEYLKSLKAELEGTTKEAKHFRR